VTNHELHIKIWDWLYQNPSKDKEDWPEWDFNGGEVKEVMALCFACKEAGINKNGYSNCHRCPIKWNGGHCENIDSEYAKWHDSKTDKTRKKYAKIIRDKEWRKHD